MNCDQVDAVRDYAFDELDAAARTLVERHIADCQACRTELDRMRLTTAALRVLPDVEIPQRIAFVSDKVFEPSPWSRWFSSARLGFGAALAMAVALVTVAYRQPRPVTVATGNTVSQEAVTRQINDAVEKAVAQVHQEDLKLTRAALEASERKYAEERKTLLATVEENLTVLEKRYNAMTSLSAGTPGGEQ
jgi:anti-sigma factor RsiW